MCTTMLRKEDVEEWHLGWGWLGLGLGLGLGLDRLV